ncbi:MAG TPA: bifunctional 23S rRNA (guanine(2069)-N(7))-methyltransferase RlmK/23S rRNA (guanine(2445)-N(2))-methyltransferase RlmL [Spirochaetia bacterium]|nr:bifunctional 23S rRNA (guanine(2069)-N(7))-methyltransferase RlmK/23S rRNA (guanine(2445)-N(2))-methyltransferase RlmL [Spirochaetia bacterium]
MPQLQFFATCPKSIEDLLIAELAQNGAAGIKETVAGAHFSGALSVAYAMCLRSRFANRILMPVTEFEAHTPEVLITGVRSVEWDRHLRVDGSFAVEAATSSSEIRHADYAALVVKDGIADYFREKYDRRPNVQPREPDLKVSLHLFRNIATVSIDLSGGSLHRRAYRIRGVAAPLKENVAAAMLARARWPEIAAAGGGFVDPMCGSGTLLVEAALMAGEIAPGLLRLMTEGERGDDKGLYEALRRLSQPSSGAPEQGNRPPQGWLGNDMKAWVAAARRAAEEGITGIARIPMIAGFDKDPSAVAAALANIGACGLSPQISVGREELSRLSAPPGRPGLLAANPPYGERIGSESLVDLYQQIGRTLHDRFRGWRACVLTSDEDLSHSVGLRASRTNTLYNGPIRCVLAHFEVSEENRFLPRKGPKHVESGPAEEAALPSEAPKVAGDGARALSDRPAGGMKKPSTGVSAGGKGERPEKGRVLERAGAPGPPRSKGTAEVRDLGDTNRRFQTTGGILSFVNRIRKNRKILEKWARQEGITCYRLYDADLPEYAVAVDYFEGRWLHVQEYVAPSEIDEDKTARRLEDIITVLPEALGVAPENVFLKRRKRRKRTEQYTRIGASGEFCEVHEGGCSFLVNFNDYLDTGLFLDHRLTRELVRTEAKGARFLNLFAYTSTASVYAAKGGARSTTSIDSSNTYLQWARENFTLNGIAGQQHRLLRADCWEWLHVDKEQYDLIFMDPPTFSNAKGKRATLDVQRDHPKLIRLGVERLARGGVLLFSTNFRRFSMDESALPDLKIENITQATIPRDYSRNRRIHSCYRITNSSAP